MTARVLVIEDNPINLELMVYLLEAFGFRVDTAAEGLQGLDAARRMRPDVVLCDIQMPVMDGFAVVRAMKADAELRRIPVIAVTAFAMVGDRDRILAAGFDGYLSKPIDPAHLVETVNAALPGAGGSRRTLAPPLQASAQAPAVTARPPTVLVLDDSPFNIELKRDLLGPHGYRVLGVDTLDEALALARSSRPDLIISDVGMRQGDGFEFIRRVKADPQLASIPFMFLSATHWDEKSRRLGLELGAIRYVTRPVDPALLLREIEDILRG